MNEFEHGNKRILQLVDEWSSRMLSWDDHFASSRRTILNWTITEWVTALGRKISLRTMIAEYPDHLELHLCEIREAASL